MNKKLIISLIVLLLSCILINFEMQRYESFDNNEFDTIRPYDKISEIMESKIKARNKLLKIQKEKEEWEQDRLKQIQFAKEKTEYTNALIKKYGIKTVLKYSNSEKYHASRKLICDYNDCNSETNAFAGMENVYVIEYDLNEDGVKEIIGYWSGNRSHRGLCINLIEKKANRYNYSEQCDITGDDIIVLNHKTDGYYDLIIEANNWYTMYKTILNVRR